MLDEELIDDKMRLAILYFKAADFERALNLYNELVEMVASISAVEAQKIRKHVYNLAEKPIVGACVHPKLGSILDQRAATHEKLDQFSKALEDSRRIVKLEPISCKGYLRVGKLLLKLKQDVEAYKTYQRGVYIIEKVIKEHSVSVPEKLFSQLKTQYKSLNKTLKTKRQNKSQESQYLSREDSHESDSSLRMNSKRAKRMGSVSKPIADPFQHLPLEIIELIFQNLAFKQLLSCHLVNKLWYYNLTKIPNLYCTRVNLKSNITLSEFTHGIRLVKRVAHKSYSQQIKALKMRSAINASQLQKIIEIIINEPNFSIRSLDMFDKYLSFQLLLNKLSKFSWKLNNLSNLEYLRLGVNSSLRYENIILELFKKLKTLYIVILYSDMSGPNNQILPTTEKYFNRLHEKSVNNSDDYESMSNLTLVNHPKLLPGESQVAPKFETYNPYPIFLDRSFSNLVELSLVSFDFFNRLPLLGEFFCKCKSLTKLMLENNFNFRMLDLFQMLQNYNPSFRLEKLLFREPKIISTTTMNEFSTDDLPQLNSLQSLDVYGSSLTTKGLMKLLRICNKGNKELTTLVMGNSTYLHFKTDAFQTSNRNLFSFVQMLRIAPNLENLYLNELDIDNQTMKQLNKDIESIGYVNCKLKVLDLSFCNRVEGIGLIDLFKAFPSNIKQINENSGSAFRIRELIIDGIEINIATLRLLQKHNFVSTIKNDPNKKRWRQYGVNTLVPV
ncbi:predicted protein [Scheffersomyces stipitis CBS 6054]|uniref:F-box domain-containing protein n=1 Tax=Scheffersomyces stipitis (strain ATCC 58785 / CBS 6054 / NBRC 10063 / NRRL Y-11545) TaxID=322104 RepID=A3LNH2_PICST|nr:predicted protein [Scheffersomyces stipitis CBS 6054]ABN64855.2 predicted protein [Scheffersomyces stipitis CBS 6054]